MDWGNQIFDSGMSWSSLILKSAIASGSLFCHGRLWSVWVLGTTEKVVECCVIVSKKSFLLIILGWVNRCIFETEWNSAHIHEIGLMSGICRAALVVPYQVAEKSSANTWISFTTRNFWDSSLDFIEHSSARWLRSLRQRYSEILSARREIRPDCLQFSILLKQLLSSSGDVDRIYWYHMYDIIWYYMNIIFNMFTSSKSFHPPKRNNLFTQKNIHTSLRPWWRCLWKTWLTWPKLVLQSRWTKNPQILEDGTNTYRMQIGFLLQIQPWFCGWSHPSQLPRLAAKRPAIWLVGKKMRRKNVRLENVARLAAKSTCSECLFQLWQQCFEGSNNCQQWQWLQRWHVKAALMPIKKLKLSCQLLSFVASWYHQCHATSQPW